MTDTRNNAQSSQSSGRRWSRFRWLVISIVAVAIAAMLLGWSPLATLTARLALKTDDIIAEERPDPAYEKLFAHYVELCATSQWNKTVADQGSPFGHAVMYIKGACKNQAASFPQLRSCMRSATSIDDPEHGVGISVGRFFKNVNWVAVPGYRLLYEGQLEPGQRLTQASFDATVRHAIREGVFDGVELHDGWTEDPTADLEEFVAIYSAGTDFALRYARNVFCARIPVPEPVITEIMDFLNEKNREYATGEADYNWSLIANNCVHTVRNALAAANIWSPITVFDVKLRSLFNLAVPANEFVNLAILGADGPLAEFRAIQGDGPARDALHEFRWLPTRPGALVKFLPTHKNNDLFDPSFRLFAVQSLISLNKTAKTLRLMSNPQYVDLETNLRYFAALYSEIEEKHKVRAAPLQSLRGDPFRRISRLHLDYIRGERANLEDLLESLETLKATDRQRSSR